MRAMSEEIFGSRHLPAPSEISVRFTGLMRQRRWRIFREKVLPILGLALAITISVMVFVNREMIAQLSMLGYPSIFLVSMAWNSTIFFPIPIGWVYFTLGTIFHPMALGLAGGAGSAIGEMTSYMTGRSGRALFKGKQNRFYTKVETWLNKYGPIVIFAFNLQPLIPFDLVGVAAGATRFPIWKYYLLTFAGRSLAYGLLAYFGSQGWIPEIPVFDFST